MSSIPSPETRVWSTVEFDQDGKQFGYLRVPFSTDLSAYGTIPIPVWCIRNGDGPTALLIAGNHGDEYEGQVGLSKLARSIEPENVRGRIIILPHLNLPATEAGRRLSPLDEGNLNRLFPGDPKGSPTQMIADYVASVMLPMADLVLDLHSGGRSLEYMPCSLIRSGGSNEETAKLVQLARIFGAPVCSVSDGSGGGGGSTLSAWAQALGTPIITAELGGGGGIHRQGEQLARQGTLRILRHLNILPEIETSAPSVMRLMHVAGREAYVYASTSGIFDPTFDVGDLVQAGSVGGFIHPFDDDEPTLVRIKRSGLIACRRSITLTARGDCLFKVLDDYGASDSCANAKPS